MAKQVSSVLIEQVKRQAKSVRKRFLVAILAPPARPARGRADGDADAGERSHELVDKRHDLLKLCQDRHWQFDELRRAHFSTMMLLANLGGAPTAAEVDAARGGA